MTQTPPPLDRRAAAGTAVDLLLALVGGVAAYLVSYALVPQTPQAHGFGVHWEKMSTDPFAFAGELPHRILGPLLAYVLGFRGAPHWVAFVSGLSIVLLATVFFFCRRRGARVIDAALVTLAVAVTAPVQMYKEHWVGYPDALNYTLFFGALLAARRPVLFWALFFLNLLTHELAAFLLPWLWFVRRREGGSLRGDAIGAASVLAVYAAYYFYVKAVAPAQLYNVDYFAANPLFPGGTFCVLVLALVQWTLAFGPILAVLAWFVHTRDHGRERLHFWLVLAGIAGIFCIAFDWQRHTNLLVIPLVIASLHFLAAGHRVLHAALVVVGAGLMLRWPPWGSSSWPTNRLADLEVLARTQVVVPAPHGPGLGFGTLRSALGSWLPEVWPWLWPILVILVAVWAAGLVYARLTAGRGVAAAPSYPAAGRGTP